MDIRAATGRRVAAGWSLFVLLLPALLGGCLAPEPADLQERQAPIIGGTPSPGDPAVVAILLRSTGCEDLAPAPLCTGALIAPDVVLTAAHCLDGLSARSLEVAFGPSVAAATERRLVVATLIHPEWNPETWEGDLALLRLDRAASIAPLPLPLPLLLPLPLPRHALDATDIGSQVRVVGYGETRDLETPMGTKLEGFGAISAVDGSDFTFTPDPAMTCHGDSGGPVLITRDGTEYLAGVTSHGDPACEVYGVNTRVDRFVESFILPFLATEPPTPNPTIAAEGICGEVCVADDDCPDLLACELMLSPPRCVLRNVPPGDLSEPCTVDDQCASGICARLGGDATPTCRCLTPCDTGIIPIDPKPKPKGCGCRLGAATPDAATPELPAGLILCLVLLLLLRRRRRRPRP